MNWDDVLNKVLEGILAAGLPVILALVIKTLYHQAQHIKDLRVQGWAFAAIATVEKWAKDYLDRNGNKPASAAKLAEGIATLKEIGPKATDKQRAAAIEKALMNVRLGIS